MIRYYNIVNRMPVIDPTSAPPTRLHVVTVSNFLRATHKFRQINTIPVEISCKLAQNYALAFICILYLSVRKATTVCFGQEVARSPSELRASVETKAGYKLFSLVKRQNIKTYTHH